MEKNSSAEKLKEVLSQERLKNSSNEEDSIENEKTTKKNKTKSSSIHSLFHVFSIIIIVLLSSVIYHFIKNPHTKIIEKKIPVVQKEIKIENPLEGPKKLEKEVKKEIEEPVKPKVIVKEVKVEVEKEKIVDLNNKNFNKYYNTSQFKSVKCYDFKEDSSILSIECKNKITKFMKDNEQSIRFEIIPIVTNKENLYQKIKNELKDLDKSTKYRVEKYLLRGLSRDRVLEVSAFIRKNFTKKYILTPTNYYVMSQKTNRGVFIRAYYHK